MAGWTQLYDWFTSTPGLVFTFVALTVGTVLAVLTAQGEKMNNNETKGN